MAVGVPNIEVYADAGRRATQPHLNTANILTGFELEVADIADFDSSNKLVVLLLLFSHGARGA